MRRVPVHKLKAGMRLTRPVFIKGGRILLNERIAETNGVKIEFIRKTKNFRKEKRIKEIFKEHGKHSGLVYVFSAMEPCTSYKPWHDKNSGKTYLKYDTGKCLHYYFYFIDEETRRKLFT